MSFGRAIRVVGFAMVAASIAGCGNSSAPSTPVLLAPCDGPVTVSVSSGTKPTISWTPACGENRLSVDLANAPTGASPTVWAITSGDIFGPSVKYGSVPSGAEANAPLVALQTGKAYTVTVLRAGGEVIIKSTGSATFTP